MQGWIKLHRKLLDWEWYSDMNTFRLFIHLLLRANHKDKNWKGKTIKRGQIISSLDKLSQETGLTKSQIRTSIKKLILTHEIAHEGRAQHTVFTIKSYDSYQCDDTLNDTEMTQKSHTNSTQIASNKNVKNVKNKDKDSLLQPGAETKNSKFKYSCDDMQMAEWMLERVKIINPSTKEPNLDSWANTIRLMTEIDKRTHKEISRLFDWANKDSFWCSNILSPTKLRKQFDKIKVKANATNQPKTYTQSNRRLSAAEENESRLRKLYGNNRVEGNAASGFRIHPSSNDGHVQQPMEAHESSIELGANDWRVIN